MMFKLVLGFINPIPHICIHHLVLIETNWYLVVGHMECS